MLKSVKWLFHDGLYSVNQHYLYIIFTIDPTPPPFIAINQRGSHLT
jgi:hypothetical protein